VETPNAYRVRRLAGAFDDAGAIDSGSKPSKLPHPIG